MGEEVAGVDTEVAGVDTEVGWAELDDSALDFFGLPAKRRSIVVSLDVIVTWRVRFDCGEVKGINDGKHLT